MRLAIVKGHVIDPARGLSAQRDIFVEDGLIVSGGPGFQADETIDASGQVVCPGLVDIHVHFREPGFESKETIETGSRAAAKGGVTSVVTMANTSPVIDNAGMVEFINRRARETASIRVFPAACATKGMKGAELTEMAEFINRRARETACIRVFPAACATKGMKGAELTEMAELRDVGAVAVTDDGRDIPHSAVLRRVLEYANMTGLVYLGHCEDEGLAEGGVMNEGFTATRLGLPGIPRAAEEIRIERLVRLSALTGAPVHIQHVSTAGGIDIVRRTKANGLAVTCETAPHYWMLTDEAIARFDTNAKMNPPLREAGDTEAIIEGLKDGTVDCIATDHAPHTPTEKNVEFAFAPFGIIGLETSLALAITGLVRPGHLTLERVIALMTSQPARICKLPTGTLSEGASADVVLLDPNAEWAVRTEEFASRSQNSPFVGYTLHGRVTRTLCEGKTVFHR